MAISRQYDLTYSTYGKGAAPVEFMRALAHMESGQNPKHQTGTHRGLFQIAESNLEDWNKRNPTSKYTKADLFAPNVNTIIWSDWLRRFQALAKGLAIEPLATPDWGNPEYVKLVTAAWNAGWSPTRGVLAMAKWLAQQGLKVTHDNVYQYASKRPNTTKFLDIKKYQDKHAWQKNVEQLYQKQVAEKLMPFPVPGDVTEAAKRGITRAAEATPRKGGNWGWLLLILLLARSKR